jgi:hypothetical protein
MTPFLATLRMKLLLIAFFFLTVFQIKAQDLTGEWITYSTLLKGRERIESDKKQKNLLILKQDSTYVKHYRTFESPMDSSKNMHLSYHFYNGKLEVRDSKGNLLKEIKRIERGTYSVRKSKQEILFTSKGQTYREHYTFENGYLIFRISMEGVVNSVEKYMYVKHKKK